MSSGMTSRHPVADSGWNLGVRVCLAGLMVPLMAVSAHGTALDDYVAAPDASYAFNVTQTYDGTGYTTYTVLMTSQTWQDPSEVNHNAWQHYMKICVPNVVTSDKALLTIGSGNHTTVPSVDTALAVSSGSVVAAIANVPCQPLTFAGETFPRSEDQIIAKTGRKYLDGADADWLALLPMVKSAVRAMDTVETVAYDQKDVTVNDFVVTGISKRGWTTWLTAAVDDRVCAIAPCVINVLNMDEQMKYHKKVYEGVTEYITDGGYSVAVQDYDDLHIFDNMDSPRFQSMLGIIDPYEYRDRLTMPKLMINATGDEFFVPDSCQFFLDNLPGENYVRYQPNLGHDVVSGKTTLEQFYKAVLNGTDLPDFSWTVEPDGAIRMTTEDVPTEVKLWQATNLESRDFRQNISDTTWTSSPLAEVGSGVYVASVPEPASGYTAFMIEMTYTVGGESMTFTTEVNVVPAVVPPGDANYDGVVDDLDASILGSHWLLGSGATWGMGDFNRDGKVNDADAAIMAANWTGDAASSVPEPGTLVLLVIGGAVVLCRRRIRTLLAVASVLGDSVTPFPRG